ncbi:MAG: hypothetical protein M0Z88_06635 [Actinomycetota bacterium]|nr:hypothetical protein [Actinomycetota bacterium]
MTVREGAYPTWSTRRRGARVMDEAPRFDRVPTPQGERPAHPDVTGLALPAFGDLEVRHGAAQGRPVSFVARILVAVLCKHGEELFCGRGEGI